MSTAADAAEMKESSSILHSDSNSDCQETMLLMVTMLVYAYFHTVVRLHLVKYPIIASSSIPYKMVGVAKLVVNVVSNQEEGFQ